MSRARDLADRVLHNRTHEDTDGGRESIVTFKGEQSGGEISTLAQIQASHDGTADDEKADLIFKTNDGSDGASPTEAMRIQSDQSVLFGSATTDDDQKIQMIKTGGSVGLGLHSNRAAAGGSALILSHNRNTSIGSFTALNDNDQLGRITFQGSDGADIKTEGAQIHAEINGTVGSNDLPTDLVFSTTADGASSITERMRILESGGITFNGDTAAANALDDYEEGTWTPVYTSAAGSFSSITYKTGTFGTYTKVGRKVTLVCTMDLDALSVGSASSNLFVEGIPFSALDSTSSYSGSVSQTSQWDSAPTQVWVRDTDQIGLGYMATSGASNYDVINVADMNNSGRNRMRFTLTYFTA